MDVVLPAGGRLTDEMARATGVTVKALLRVDGETLLERTLSLLRQVPGLDRLVVVGPREIAGRPEAALADACLPEGETGPENLLRGLAHLGEQRAGEGGWGPDDEVLVLATDLPYLRAADFAELLEARSPDAGVTAPIHTRAQFEAEFPDCRIQYVPLRDGYWTLGSVLVMRPAAIMAARPRLESVFAARKSNLAMARVLGPLFVLRFLLRALAVPDLERRCEALLGVKVAAVRGCSPRLAYDIDDMGDWDYLLRHPAVGR